MIYIIYLPPQYNPYDYTDPACEEYINGTTNVVHPVIRDADNLIPAPFLSISISDFATKNLHSFVYKFSQYLKTYGLDIHSMRTFLTNLYTTTPQQFPSEIYTVPQ